MGVCYDKCNRGRRESAVAGREEISISKRSSKAAFPAILTTSIPVVLILRDLLKLDLSILTVL